MKKNFFISIFIIIVLVGSLFLYLKTHPPLSYSGITDYTEDEKKRVIEIENTGFVNVELNAVLVNGRDKGKVELGVSRSNHIIMGSGLDEDPAITFHSIDEFPIKPQSNSEERAEKINKDELQSIKFYGIRIFGHEEPKVITIKYKYLGMPFSLEVDTVKK
ncbi:MAG: hypothetical protein R3267_02410 [Paenisporosarcina sp.]|nr:hypothetical protein [Paenisporosarcina sp.]